MIFTIVFILLLLVNAYFSAAEIALVSVKKIKLQQSADSGDKRALEVLDLTKDPDQFLSSIQVGITLVGIIEGLYGGVALASFIEPTLISWGIQPWLAHSSALIFSIGLITYISIVIGELLPKSLALQYPQKTALSIISSFTLFTRITYPFVKLLTASTHFLVRLMGIKGSEKQELSEADVRSLLGVAYKQGIFDKNEWKLHDNIFNFYDQTVENIMTTKDKVIFIEAISTRDAVENILRNSHHQVFPVMHQDNKIAGCLYVKDFFINGEKSLKEITVPACVIALKQTASDLLKNFKEKNRNFAIVVNGSGELAGVVTMHDIGEILIGKIP